MTARVGIITFPGTLDDVDAARAARRVGAEAVNLWHADAYLKSVDAVVVPSASLRTHTGPTDQYTLHGHIARAEGTFLDDMTLAELSGDLQVPVVPSGANLAQLLDHLEAADQLRTPMEGRDLSRVFHPEGLNLPQGAYNP
mgnify:CR=1 FL=1